jgi:hypothetical protein
MMQSRSFPSTTPSRSVPVAMGGASSSCLSAQLEKALVIIGESSGRSFQEEDTSESSDHSTEPPLSVHDYSGVSYEDPQEFSLNNSFSHRRRPCRISPITNLNLAASPHTASSPQELEQEYNRDTWRMYQRINSGRSSSSSPQPSSTLLDSRHVPLSTIHSDRDDSYSSYSEDPFTQNGIDLDEQDAMFELDLE